MICSECGYRKAEPEPGFWGRWLCSECAQALSEEVTAVPLDRVPERYLEDALTVAEIERCCL
jgi:hypothetical protein